MKLANVGAPGKERPIVMTDSGTVFDAGSLTAPGSLKTDWEVELAVVIGTTRARYLASPDESSAHIAGFTISNDVSERAYRLERGGRWDKRKSCESFNPLGPWLVTPDEIPDPQALGLRLWVNGELRQNGTTSDMIFDVSYLVWYVSQFMVLEPGDVINTGTPAGVVLGSPGLSYLGDGDEVQIEITGLGSQQQKFQAA
jgi:2-keto-4-pentenoate hydratase/2-oxohepta-3-ene-1,7-dioic acid hydratase in catechol pathway